jgi:hypothetical protein
MQSEPALKIHATEWASPMAAPADLAGVERNGSGSAIVSVAQHIAVFSDEFSQNSGAADGCLL